MRLVATEYVSLDGVFHEPGEWSMPFFDEQAGAFKLRELQASDALLLGRRTYEGFAAAWPSMPPDEAGFGEKMNTRPKYVVSSTLTSVDWPGSQLVTGDIPAEVAKLKEQPGGDLLLSGSAQLFNALRRENLIDLYRLMLHPVALGGGARLFDEDDTQQPLKLIGTETFGSGIVILEYEPVAA
jgi:dihydrofolate reductase